MTKIAFLISVLAMVGMVLLVIVGLTSTQPVLLITGFFCAGPGMMFALGVGIGRSSNEFTLVRKRPTLVQPVVTNSRIERARQGEIVS